MGALRNPLLVWMSKRLEHAVYKASKSVIALSPGMRDGVVRAGVDGSKVHVVPNASDLDLFDPSLSGALIRKDLNLQGKFVCVHLGALGEIHDVTDCLEVARALSESGINDVVFVFVGDGKRRASLEDYCGLHHLDNVIFIDPVPRREVPQYLAAADVSLVFVKDIPSLRSASPNKFFDALGAGVPVILNCLGWLKEIVEEANAGEYVPAGEPLELRRVILGLKDNPSRLAAMGVNARVLAENRFERRALAGRATRVLEDAL
jgi:glycosyltransferase involved in cell wall biosynthesis